MTLEGVDGLERAFAHCEALVRQGMVTAVRAAVKAGADEARRRRQYTDRTHRLTGTIDYEFDGASGDDVDGFLVADMPYASFVEYGTARSRPHPYMKFGIAKAERVLQREMEAAVNRATESLAA